MDHVPTPLHNPTYNLDEYLPLTTDWLTNPFLSLVHYYTAYYLLAKEDSDDLQGDLVIRQAPNKLCVIGLAPTHPVRQCTDFSKLSIKYAPAHDAAIGVSPAKGRKNIPWIGQLSPIAFIHLGDKVYTVKSGIHGQLLELNERLLQTPRLLVDKPDTEGYIAIIKPKVENTQKSLSHCLTEEKWRKERYPPPDEKC